MNKVLSTPSSPRSCVRRALMVTLGAALAGGIGSIPSPAYAHGKAASTTATFHDVSELLGNTDPCTGVAETVSVTQNGVLHLTEHADGHYHITGTVTGDFTATPVDATQPTYTGRFTVRFGQNDNATMDDAHFTNTIQAVGSDGSIRRFHGLSHITAATIDFSSDPAQISDVKVTIDRARCG